MVKQDGRGQLRFPGAACDVVAVAASAGGLNGLRKVSGALAELARALFSLVTTGEV